MITTSTPNLTEKKQQTEGGQFPETIYPSDKTLNFILNYSKNLEITKSRFITEIEVIKS